MNVEELAAALTADHALCREPECEMEGPHCMCMTDWPCEYAEASRVLLEQEATITQLRSTVQTQAVTLRAERATIDRLTAEAEHLGERLAEADHMAKLMYLQSERWHEMAEDLHEELAEWHYDGCLQTPDCNCHTLLEARWTELVEGNQ